VTPVLQLTGVGKTYCRGDEQVRVLRDFDFALAAVEFVVVTGPSGAGKSRDPGGRRPDSRGHGRRSPAGFFVLGASCQIELLVGSFNCEQRAGRSNSA